MTDAAYGGAVGRSLQKKSPPAWPETIPCGRIVIPRTCARGIPPVRVDQKVGPGIPRRWGWGRRIPVTTERLEVGTVDMLSRPRS